MPLTHSHCPLQNFTLRPISRNICQLKPFLIMTTPSPDNQDRIDFLLRSSPAVIYIRESTGSKKTTFISHNVEDFLGYPVSEHLENPKLWLNCIHPFDVELVLEGMIDLHENGHSSLEYRLRHQDGHYHWIRDEMRLVQNAHGLPNEIVGAWTNIDQTKQAETKIQAQHHLLEEIQAAQTQFISGADLKKVFNTLLSGIVGLTESEFGFLGEVIRTADGNTGLKLHTIANLSMDIDTSLFMEHHEVIEHGLFKLDNLIGAALLSGEYVISNDPFTDSRAGGMPKDHPPIRSFLGLPVKAGDKVTGLIGIANRPVGYNHEIVHYLQPLLLTCANIFDAAHAELRRKQAESELVAAKDEAERANRAKTEFLSSMSHELRTPLNAILGFAQLMEIDNSLGNEHHLQAQKIHHAGLHLLDLINDVLDLARIEAGPEMPNLELVPLMELLDTCQTLASPLARKREIQIEINAEHVIRSTVLADRIRLKQALLNLLSNAVKYNREGGSIKLYCSRPTPGHIRINVEDTGYGIPKEKQSQLFQSFNRLGAERSDIEGTGIGLALTKRLIEGIGGEIGFHSEAGTGSLFWLDLPEGQALTHDQEHGNPQHVFAPQLTGRVLIAEDNPVSLEVLRRQLETLGLQVETAEHGRLALARWHLLRHDAILTDINMPEMDGYQLAHAVRRSESVLGGRVPIIAVTANALSGDEEACITNGMDDYLTKPITLAALTKALRRWLPQIPCQQDAENMSPQNADAPTDTAPQVAPLDISILAQYVGDDLVLQVELLKQFADSSPEIIQVIQEGVALHAADKVTFSAHKLKSSARAMGATALADCCLALEVAGKDEHWSEIQRLAQCLPDMMREIQSCITNMGSS